MSARGFTVRALGEIAIRCRDIDAMRAFYRDVIGLPVLAEREEGIVFFRISQGFAGHTAVLALFEPGSGRPDLHPTADAAPAAGAGSSLHHLALSVAWDEQDAAAAWLRSRGARARFQNFDWIGWRGLFTTDPDGNAVELVAARPPPEAPR